LKLRNELRLSPTTSISQTPDKGTGDVSKPSFLSYWCRSQTIPYWELDFNNLWELSVPYGDQKAARKHFAKRPSSMSGLRLQGRRTNHLNRRLFMKPSVGESVIYQFQEDGSTWQSTGVVLVEIAEDHYHLVDMNDGKERFCPPGILVSMTSLDQSTPKRIFVAADRPRLIDPTNEHDWSHLASRSIFGCAGNTALILVFVFAIAPLLGYLWSPLAWLGYLMAAYSTLVGIRWAATGINALKRYRELVKGHK
jgi:hypothetical protein